MRDMRRLSFYADTNRSGNLLHIETDGAVINVHVGLHDGQGRQVTRVSVLPDDDSRGGDGEGRIWVRDGDRVVRLHEGETGLPASQSSEPVCTVTREQIAEIMEREPTESELARIAKALPHSSVPVAVRTVTEEIQFRGRPTENTGE